MADKEPSATAKDAEAAVRKLKEEGFLSDEDSRRILEKISSRTAETGDAARAVVAARAVEIIKPKLLTLVEADNFLREHNIPINLSEAREEDVRDMLRWGAIASKDADNYGAAFDNPQIPEQALLALETELKTNSGLVWEPVFELENRTDAQAYDEDIVKSGINHYEYRTLSLYRRIDPETKRVLPDQRPTNKAHVVFTPYMLNVDPRFTSIAANAQLEKMAAGHKYMPPSRWIKYFLRSVDTGLRALYPRKNIDAMKLEDYKAFRAKTLKERASNGSYPIDQYLLDAMTITQFSDLRSIENLNEDRIKDANLSSAVAPCLYFRSHPDDREVTLCGCSPVYPGAYLGGRPELG